MQTDNDKLITIPGRFTKNMRLVLVECARNHTPKLIAQKIGKSRSNVYRTLQSLIEKNLVTKEDQTNQYFLSSKGKDVALSVTDKLITKKPDGSPTDNEKHIRGHNIRIKFKIQSKPEGWEEQPKAFTKLQNVEFEDLNIDSMQGTKFHLDNYFIRATAYHIIATSEATYSKKAYQVIKDAMPLAFKLKERLEKEFRQLKLSNWPVITLGETAIEGDQLAKIKNEYKVIYHTDNRARVQIDQSRGIELEFLHRGLFDHDSETWERRVTQLLDSPVDYDTLAVRSEQEEYRNDEQDQKIDKLTQLNEMLTENVLRITDMLQKNKKSIEKLQAKLD